MYPFLTPPSEICPFPVTFSQDFCKNFLNIPQLRKGYVFTSVCQQFCPQGGGEGGVCMAKGEACVARETSTAADGAHPTGMHSCYPWLYAVIKDSHIYTHKCIFLCNWDVFISHYPHALVIRWRIGNSILFQIY